MMGKLFDRKPGYQAQVLAEAQAFIDDGLEPDFVLGLFPDDAEWLEGMLGITTGIADAYASEPASYYFEASLKSMFLDAARRPAPAPVLVTAPSYSPARTAVASMGVLASAAAVGVLALGFVTAGDAVPGDWNYTFKLANERFEYTLSRGDGRVDVQLRQAEERVHELQTLESRGSVSSESLNNFTREVQTAIADLSKDKPLDEVQKARAKVIGEASKTVLTKVRAKEPALDQEAAAAAAAVDEFVTRALGPEPTPTTEPTAAVTEPATETPEPTETETPTPEPSETPVTATAEPEGTTTEAPSETPTPRSGSQTVIP